MKTFALVAIAAFAAATPAAAVTNLVGNGSFEAGLSGWTIGGVDNDTKRVGGYPPAAITLGSASGYPTGAFGEAVPANAIGASSSPDAPGTRAAYFVSDFAVNQSLSQVVFLTPGNYEIGFSAYAPGNGFNNKGDATFSGTIGGKTLAAYAVSGEAAKTWVNYAGFLTIQSAGSYDVNFVFNTNFNPSKDVVIDQVYIVASDIGGPVVPGIPEPATWAMLIAGFGMVGFAARRRREASFA